MEPSSPARHVLNPSAKRIAALILAAGASRRFNGPKLLVPLPEAGGRTVIQRVLDVALDSHFDRIVIVLGCYAEQMEPLLLGQPVTIVRNHDWETGMSCSLRIGLDHGAAECDAAVVILADQPAISSELVRQLIAAYRETGAPIVVPVHAGRRGNPVLFDRQTFDKLRGVTGDQGGRQVIASGQFDVVTVEVDDAAVLLDIDRPEDLQQVRQHLNRRGDAQQPCKTTPA